MFRGNLSVSLMQQCLRLNFATYSLGISALFLGHFVTKFSLSGTTYLSHHHHQSHRNLRGVDCNALQDHGYDSQESKNH